MKIPKLETLYCLGRQQCVFCKLEVSSENSILLVHSAISGGRDLVRPLISQQGISRVCKLPQEFSAVEKIPFVS